jgi:hypothetical protein
LVRKVEFLKAMPYKDPVLGITRGHYARERGILGLCLAGNGMRLRHNTYLLVLLALTVSTCSAQQLATSSPGEASQKQPCQQMPGMQMPCPENRSKPDEENSHKEMPRMKMSANSVPVTFVEEIERHGTSGTSAEPKSTPTAMLMTIKGKWMLMFHGEAFLNVLQQSGSRGSDKVFSTNWFMPMAQRQFGPGTFTARAMVSFEPRTVTNRYYPELFQQGETAFGRPIVDGQHPHDFIMELAALYDVKMGEKGLLSFYFAPVGDPAMGPTAYPHRASAAENPMAALGHHLEDSTHIADDVITAGLTYKIARFEASGFHGREPDEFRWDIDSGKIDSWSVRATVNPAQNWSAQYSFAHLTSPEALHPNEDVDRMTASVMYNRALARGNWSSTLLWGRNRTSDGLVWNGYLGESTLRFAERNYVWSRIENVDRTNELLLRNLPEPPAFQETVIGRVQAYTAGYSHDLDLIPHLATALGAQVTLYSPPNALKVLYGNHPLGAVIFLRLRPFGAAR